MDDTPMVRPFGKELRLGAYDLRERIAATTERKLCLVIGDGGCGKATLVLQVVDALQNAPGLVVSPDLKSSRYRRPRRNSLVVHTATTAEAYLKALDTLSVRSSLNPGGGPDQHRILILEDWKSEAYFDRLVRDSLDQEAADERIVFAMTDDLAKVPGWYLEAAHVLFLFNLYHPDDLTLAHSHQRVIPDYEAFRDVLKQVTFVNGRALVLDNTRPSDPPESKMFYIDIKAVRTLTQTGSPAPRAAPCRPPQRPSALPPA